MTEHKTPCVGKCFRLLDLADARPCAILICANCRKDDVKLTNARRAVTKHLAKHLLEERKTNPWYPFENFHATWNAV